MKASGRVAVERVYEAPDGKAGAKLFLVDRLWPRGIKKESLKLEAWLKDLSPSQDLRKWFGHDPARWEEFQRRYKKELDSLPDSAWQPLLQAAKKGKVVLLYAAKDQEHNNALVLKEMVEKRL